MPSSRKSKSHRSHHRGRRSRSSSGSPHQTSKWSLDQLGKTVSLLAKTVEKMADRNSRSRSTISRNSRYKKRNSSSSPSSRSRSRSAIRNRSRSKSHQDTSNHDPVDTKASLPPHSHETLSGNQNQDEDVIELDASDLDEETLALIGKVPVKPVTSGPNLHPVLTDRWANFMEQGLEAADKSTLMESYPYPANCQFLTPPLINEEVLATIPEFSKERDSQLLLMQKQLAAATTALGKGLELLLKPQDDPGSSQKKVIQSLGDAAKLLLDAQHHQNEKRKQLLISNMKSQRLKTVAGASKTDVFLFGSDLSQKLKSAEEFEKLGKTLADKVDSKAKPFKPKIFAKSGANYKSGSKVKSVVNIPKGSLNYRRPSYLQNRASGGRPSTNRTSTYRTSNYNRH